MNLAKNIGNKIENYVFDYFCLCLILLRVMLMYLASLLFCEALVVSQVVFQMERPKVQSLCQVQCTAAWDFSFPPRWQPPSLATTFPFWRLTLQKHWSLSFLNPKVPHFPSAMAFSEFRPLDEKSLIDYIKAVPSLSSKLGNNLDGLKIKEVGDGNLNFVYIVIGPAGSLVIKQVSFFPQKFACRLAEHFVCHVV